MCHGDIPHSGTIGQGVYFCLNLAMLVFNLYHFPDSSAIRLT